MTRLDSNGRRKSAQRVPLRLALAWALGGVAIGHGQIVAWDVNGRTAAGSNPFAATTLGSGLAGASLTLGGGVSASGTANTFGASSFDQTSMAAAISAGDYLSFTLTPADGVAVSLTSMSALFGVGTAVTNFNLALMSSIPGFDMGDELWTHGFGVSLPAAQVIDMTSIPALQALTGPLEFRLYGWRDPVGTTTFRIRDNAGSDLAIFGTTAVIPEPSSYAAAAGALILALALGRRGRRPPDGTAVASATPGGGSAE
jgi:hypothetical protein